jgi:hypothetical protein
MDDEQELVAGLTLQQLMAVSNILYFYERHIWHFATPTPKRTRQLVEIQMLLVKMPLLATSKIGIFTPSEVGYMEAAIEAFVKQAREKIPQSENRDAVIESCEELREYLVKALLPANKH